MNLVINGQTIEAQTGDTLMTAARRAGIEIPGLCHDDATGGSHSCRLCMVEVEEKGRRQIVAACAFPVREGLTVETEGEQVQKLREVLLKLLYLEAPENPAVLDLMARYGIEKEQIHLPLKARPANGLDGCILCYRCVNACESVGASAISMVQRGVDKRVDTPYAKASGDCIGCAACAEACPIQVVPVKDTQDGRTIWNKDFEWQRCDECGAVMTTKEHYQACVEKLPADIEKRRALCPACARRKMTDTLAY